MKFKTHCGIELTARQRQVATAIAKLTKANRRPPTIRELGAALGIISPNGVMCHVKALRQKGTLEPSRKDSASRGFVLAGVCPCCGRADD